MPVNRKKMKALKSKYGEKKGESVYYAMEKHPKKKKHRKNMAKEVMHKMGRD